MYCNIVNLGQKGKPEFLKDDEEFDVNTEKGTKRSASSKPQGYDIKCLCINIQRVPKITDLHK